MIAVASATSASEDPNLTVRLLAEASWGMHGIVARRQRARYPRRSYEGGGSDYL